MSRAELNFKRREVTINGDHHYPSFSTDVLAEFEKLAGVIAHDPVADRLLWKEGHTPTFLYVMCGGEHATGLSLAAWREAFASVPGPELVAFVKHIIAGGLIEPPKMTPPPKLVN